MNKEIEAGERELASAKAKLPDSVAGSTRSVPRAVRRTEKEIRKEQKGVERTIAQLDLRRKELTNEFTATTDPKTAIRLELELNEVSEQLAAAEDQWMQLNEELGEAEQ